MESEQVAGCETVKKRFFRSGTGLNRLGTRKTRLGWTDEWTWCWTSDLRWGRCIAVKYFQ